SLRMRGHKLTEVAGERKSGGPTIGLHRRVGAARVQYGSIGIGLRVTRALGRRTLRMTGDRYDVIIIRTGAGGGTLLFSLAPSAKRVLVLERGEFVPREKENWSPRAVNLEGRYQTKEVWRDRKGKALHPHTNYWVGGNTKFYGSALFRMRREDFGEV